MASFTKKTLLGLTLACLVVAGVPAVLADEHVPVGGGLEIGPWSAAAHASGVAEVSQGGLDLQWDGEIPAQFEFVVVDGGEATGTWEHQGTATQTGQANLDGRDVTLVATMSFSGGGAVSGDNTLLILDGQSRSTGSLTATSADGSFTFPIDNTSTIPTLSMSVQAAVCDEAYGEWAYTVETAFEDEGFLASFDGYWIGIRGSEAVNEELETLLEAARQQGADAPDLESPSELLQLAAQLLREYNGLVDSFPDWSLGQVLDTMSRAEWLLNSLRNLTECDRKLFGEDNVEQFFNGLTFVIQNLIVGVSGMDGLSSATWQQLAQIASRTGAIGPGAPNPAAAVSAEQALIDAGEAILEANVDPEDGLIFVNDDTKRVMAEGAARNWTYHVDGTTYDARATYQAFLAEGGSAP